MTDKVKGGQVTMLSKAALEGIAALREKPHPFVLRVIAKLYRETARTDIEIARTYERYAQDLEKRTDQHEGHAK